MANSGAIQAGRAYVELFADDSKLQQGLKLAQARLKAFGTSVQSLGKGAFLAASAVLTGLGAGVKSFIASGDQLAKMSQRTGVAVEALSELKFAAGQSGTDLETLETSLRKMQATLVDAANGSSSAVKALEHLGLKVEDIQALNPEQQFKLMADRLSQIQNPTARAAAALDIFGKSGTQLLPLMEQGAAGMEALQQQARDLGLTISTNTAQAAVRAGDAIDVMWAAIKRAGQAAGEVLLPVVEKLSKSIADTAARTTKWISANAELVNSAALAAAGLLAFGAAAIFVGKAMTGLAATIKAVSVAMTFLSKHPLVSTAVLVGVAIAALVAKLGLLNAAMKSTVDILRGVREEGERLRGVDIDLIDKLQRLAQQERLTNQQREEARDTIKALEERYGHLAISFDRVTGSLHGVGEAMKNVNAIMRQRAVTDLMKEIKALRAEAIDIFTVSFANDDIIGVRRQQEVLRQYEDRLTKIRELLRQIHAIQGGDTGALAGRSDATGLPPGPEVAPLPDFSGEDMMRQAEDWARRVHQLRLELIQDEHERETALLNERYDHEVELAKANSDMIAQIEEARGLELQALALKNQQAIALSQQQAAEQAAQMQEQINADNRGEQQTVDELRLRIMKKGMDLELGLLDMQERRALEDARARGLDLSLVNEEFELRRKMLMDAISSAAVDRLQSFIESRGTFQKSTGALLGLRASQPIETLVKYSEQTAKATTSIDHKMQPGAAFVFE